MNFKSDHIVPMHPQILSAIVQSNEGYAASYGNDDYTLELKKKLQKIFAKDDIAVFNASTGTVANALALSACTPSYGTIYCHQNGHINNDECGAPFLFTGGAKIFPLRDNSQNHGKISPQSLEQAIDSESMRPHNNRPSTLSITQATEWGTVYTIDEVKELTKIARSHNMTVHMDGARFTNALVHLDCHPADITWRAGVDVLCFGAVKNGGFASEMIVFFNTRLAENFDYMHKRGGQLTPKMRFFSAALNAYLKDDLWIKNARAANLAAQELVKVFSSYDEIKLVAPVDANEIFIQMPASWAKYLEKQGANFYPWGDNNYRFVTSYCTSIDSIKDLKQHLDQIKQSHF